MRFQLLTVLLLASFVSTNPMPVNALSSGEPTPSAPDQPWGPDDFHIIVAGQGPNPLAPEACYVSAITMLAAQAAHDFHGQLPSPRVTFTDAQYPDLAIIVAGAHAADCVPRRYMLWGIARLMDHMVSQNDFRDSFVVLMFQGSIVGNIYIGPPPEASTQSNTTNNALKTLELSLINHPNSTTISLTTTTALSFQFQPYGRALPMSDIFMGAIGALIAAARPASDAKLQSFMGLFMPYMAIYHWFSSPAGASVFTYRMLIQAIQASAMYALQRKDLRELSVRAIEGTREVGRGGYSTA